MQWQRFVSLFYRSMWDDYRRNATSESFDEWERAMNAPLPPVEGGTERGDEATLDKLIADGFALDRIDAAEVLAHQIRVAKITDTRERITVDQQFKFARIERLRARGLVGGGPSGPAPGPPPPTPKPRPELTDEQAEYMRAALERERARTGRPKAR